VQNCSQTSVTPPQTNTCWGVMFDRLDTDMPLENITSTESQPTSSSIRTRLTSNQKVIIGVGNRT
jgi:hypothetical protein